MDAVLAGQCLDSPLQVRIANPRAGIVIFYCEDIKEFIRQKTIIVKKCARADVLPWPDSVNQSDRTPP
jgi:hypothetical protein